MSEEFRGKAVRRQLLLEEVFMAHCPFEKLSDLKPLLDQIRTLEKIKETKAGIFYLKGQGFLHFHINKEEDRWMDAREGKNWGDPIAIPKKISSKALNSIFKEIQTRYTKTINA